MKISRPGEYCLIIGVASCERGKGVSSELNKLLVCGGAWLGQQCCCSTTQGAEGLILHRGVQPLGLTLLGQV